MSRVFSIDSEGIWNACTMKVITKIAITTVPISDCSEPIMSVPRSSGAFDGEQPDCGARLVG